MVLRENKTEDDIRIFDLRAWIIVKTICGDQQSVRVDTIVSNQREDIKYSKGYKR